MNILHINTRYIGGGGAAAIANLLHNEINKQEGIKSRFLYGRGQSNDNNAIKVSYEFESYISAGVTRVFGKPLNREISKEVKKEIDNADIIHIHNLHGYYINYESLIDYIVEKDKKVIWTLHDTWAITGRCAFTFGCEKWKFGCGNCKNLNVYPITKKDISDKLWKKKQELFNKLNKNKTEIVTPSNWLMELIKESYLKDFNVKVINNGVEESKYIDIDKSILRKELGLPLDKKIALFVAADPNDERKGVKYILDILDDLSEDVIFVSMGKEINIKNDKLIQLGYKSCRDDIYKVYRASDIFVIPSLDDNFPTTVLESFGNGTPVIGFNQGGIPEQIVGKTGVLVDKFTCKALTEAIDRLLNDSEKIDFYSDNARKRFISEYTVNMFLSRYIDIYQKIYKE